MRLKITQSTSNVHTDLASAVGWNPTNELYSCSDDKNVSKWDMNGEHQGQVCSLDAFFTDLHWYPVGSKREKTGSDVFVVSCTDGTFKIVNKNGRLEKSVEAHRGAVISLRWNYEGTALVTAGEDGLVKIWSRPGLLRSTLSTTDNSIYSIAWGPDSDQVLFASGKDLTIKPLQPSAKQLQWKAHEGTVLKVDWNPINNLIVSGGEDCRYKVWDCFGRLLYQSSPCDHAVTSVSWCPDGELFAVGSFNLLRLCDKTGWTYAKEKTKTGSLLNIGWTTDGTQLAGAGGSGAVCFAQIIDRTIEWKRISATLEENNRIRIQDVLSETIEELDFRDRVIKMSLGFNHLIVATATQCSIYNTSNWNTPHIFDLKETVNLILQCDKCFLMVDNFNGIQLFSYEGRQICNPKFQGLRTEFLNGESVCVSGDTVAVIDRSDSKAIRFFDAAGGKQIGEPVTHTLEITEIALNQTGPNTDRKLIFIDRNRDLYITPVLKPSLIKLGTMVDSAVWNDTSDMLATMIDQKLVVWYYPNAVYVDKDLVPLTKYVKEGSEFGKVPKICYFHGSRVTVRRSDGALMTATVAPYPLLLYEHTQSSQWDRATRLCRYVKDNSLWACLAAMSIHHKNLNTAEVAFAALEELDKLQYVLHIKDMPTEEGRSAELALFRRRPDEAESILLQAGLTYRAIKMNIRLFNWDRALELAVNYRTHVDTVIYFRQKHLEAAKRQETNKRFLQYVTSVQVEEEAIKAKIQQEKEKESQRPGAKRAA
ncbi:Intraflagellar transport protein 80 [Cymbomonas tetramitiformis]|uniref:Intraflagellar transport protein 80 n=1 Tax=Cymbomonas tetramitiformis TaxID=36881 RepID=A0AAE0G5X5_9CHLO|nr:Intraflagellar transport protein 80 [Cymbomonas tetramitiformis]|eukprot:gene6164-7394_t